MSDNTITTSEQGLTCGYDRYAVANGTVPFYFAAPAAAYSQSPLPVVLVVHEIFGVHAYIADVCRRFAQRGYLALAPDLYVRQGDASRYGADDLPRLMSELVARVPNAQVMADLDGALDWAQAHGGDAARMAVTGFCWGGRVTWLYSAHSERVRAGVAWYGRLVGAPTALSPLQPVDVAQQLHAPVLGLYGGQDTGIPVSTVEDMQQALTQAANNGNAAARASEFVVYPQAAHAFHADYRPNYRAADAADGFERACAWFAAHGVA